MLDVSKGVTDIRKYQAQGCISYGRDAVNLAMEMQKHIQKQGMSTEIRVYSRLSLDIA